MSNKTAIVGFFIFLSLLFVTGSIQELKAQNTSGIAVSRHKSPPGARVYFIEPANDVKVSNPVTVKFGLKGMTLAPAGTVQENTGHHHLLIDLKTLPPMDQPLPANEHIQHFGKGQTETTLTLTPGQHTLKLLLADGNHIPHDPPVMSKKITMRVE